MPLFRRKASAQPARASLAIAPDPDDALYRPLAAAGVIAAGALRRPWHEQRAE
jgi:hypothetical protein